MRRHSIGRKKRASLSWLFLGTALLPDVAEAEYCKAKPTSVIVHDSQAIYFTAENVCQDWCQLNPEWSDANKDRAFSLLTTAIVQNRSLVFFFPNGCGRQQVFAQPQTVTMTSEP